MSYDRIIRDALRLARAPRRFALGGEADPKDISPSISNPVSVFPKPQRMFPSDAPVPGGQYLGMPDKQDMTGHKSAVASIGVHPGGKPYFNASRDAVDQTGTAGKAKTKTNLFKQKAGWSWQTAPEGHEDTNTIVSVEHRGKHYYTLNAHFPKGVDFARYAESRSEPRLRPTTTGDVFLGPQAGTISVRGKEHPVYHHVVVKADGGAVGYASGGNAPLGVDHPDYQKNLENFMSRSVLKDESGKPIRLYHGTSADVVFKRFKKSDRGIWLTENPKEASSYAELNDSMGYKTISTPKELSYERTNTASRVIPVHANITNPYKLTDEDRRNMRTAKSYQSVQSNLFNKARALGHDGVDMGDGVWVAFEPEQVKSAIGNVGTFDPTKKEFGYASGGDVDQPRKLDDMGFYSSAAESARSLPQSKGTPQQMLATMKGVKPAELEWSGVQDKFAGQKSVTKDDLAQHFEQNVPQIRETVLGGGINPEIIKKRTEIKDMYWPEISRLQNIAMPFAIEAQSATKEYEDKINELRNRMVEDMAKEVGFTKEKSQELVNDFKDHIVINQYPEEVKNVNAIKERINNALENKRIESLKVEEVKRLMYEHMDSEAPLPNLEPTKYQDYTVGGIHKDGSPSQRNYREVLLHLPGEKKFQSAHWDPANIVTHLRMQDRGPNNNILHLEELQSDWAQKGRDEGFSDPQDKINYETKLKDLANRAFEETYQNVKKALNETYQNVTNETHSEDFARKFANKVKDNFLHHNAVEMFPEEADNLNKLYEKYKNYFSGVPKSPYVTNTDHWVELGLKRALLEAARGGYDKLVWTPGEEQAKRYDLSRHVAKILYNPEQRRLEYIKVGDRYEIPNEHPEHVLPEELPRVIGREAADKLLATKQDKYGTHSLGGLDLKIGGEGMKSFYDKMLPSALRRVLKPHTDKIQPTSHVVKGNDGEDVTLPGIEITPELRESILKRGFSYYARGGEVRQHFEVGGGAAGGDSDSSGGGFGDSGSGGDSAPEATQDSPAFSTDAPPSYSPPESDPSMLGGATGMAFSPPGSGSLGVGVGNTSGSFLGTAEQQLNTGPGIVGFIGGTPLGLVALGAEKLNEAARAQGYDVVDPGGARPGRGTEQAAREQAAYEAGFPGNRSGGNDSGMIPDPLAPEPSFYGFRLSNDDEETQAGMVKPVGFAPPPAPMMAHGGVPRNSHPALSIPGVHIREEIHGRPIFLGERDG